MVVYDPFSDAVLDDPHPVYRRLRAEAPVYHVEAYDCYALSRFDDIWRASTDPIRYSVARGTSAPQLLTKVLPVFPNLNHMDPPDHTALRKRIAPFFTPGAAARFEGTVRDFAREAIETFAGRGRCDALADFGGRVAVQVACAVNGFPMEDAEYLIDVVRRFFAREEGVVGMPESGLRAFEEMQAYLVDLVRARRASPGDDTPIGAILASEIAGERPSDDTLASHVTLLLVGATETLPKVFASALVRLEEHPEQRRELAADPTLVPHAFEEALRYDMPTQFLCRTTTRDVEIRGVTIPEGRPVLFLYPSANRDEHEFRDPDRFDIHRRPPRILSFGHGIHRCLGAHFARLEGRVLLEETLARFPDYRVDHAKAKRERTEFVQGYNALPIEFEAV